MSWSLSAGQSVPCGRGRKQLRDSGGWKGEKGALEDGRELSRGRQMGECSGSAGCWRVESKSQRDTVHTRLNMRSGALDAQASLWAPVSHHLYCGGGPNAVQFL